MIKVNGLVKCGKGNDLKLHGDMVKREILILCYHLSFMLYVIIVY